VVEAIATGTTSDLLRIGRGQRSILTTIKFLQVMKHNATDVPSNYHELIGADSIIIMTYKFRPMPTASVAIMTWQLDRGSLNSCACSTRVAGGWGG
jgi:hypothetical protein